MGPRRWLMLALLLFIAHPAHGQGSMLDSSAARKFIGTWVFAMEIPAGAQETVRVWDKDGKVAASVQAGRFPPLDVPNITKDGDSLVLKVQRFENGQPIQAVVTLTPDGDLMKMTQDLEGSRVRKFGSGKKLLN